MEQILFKKLHGDYVQIPDKAKDMGSLIRVNINELGYLLLLRERSPE